MSVVIAAAGIGVLAWGPAVYSVWTDLDINSGCCRQTGRVLGMAVWSQETDSTVSRLLKDSGAVLGAPAWRTCHYWGANDSRRIQYTHGHTRATLRNLERAFAELDVPAPERIRLARTVLQSAGPGVHVLVQLTDSGGIELRSGDSTIATWNPVKP